jgi:thiamine biosynthesis lipoprotein
VRGLAAVSVAAPHCVLAGSASTIAMLKEEEGTAWLEELGLEYVAMDGYGELFSSSGLA